MMPTSGVSHQQYGPIQQNQMNRRLPRFSRRMVVRAVGAIAVLSAVMTLFSSRSSAPRTMHMMDNSHMFDARAQMFMPTTKYVQALHPSVENFHRMSFGLDHETSGMQFALPGNLGIEHVSAPNSFYSDADNKTFIEVRVPTADCTINLYCRCRLIIVKEGDEVKMYAGYLIYYKLKDVAAPVTPLTIKRITTNTLKDYTSWAKSLIVRANKLMTIDIPEQVLIDTIMAEVGTALKCTSTSEQECHSLLPLEIKPPCPEEPTEPSKCAEFWASSTSYTTKDEFLAAAEAAGCGGGYYYYNRLGADAPMCKGACVKEVDGCKTSTDIFIANYNLQDNTNSDGDCMAQGIKPFYHTYTLPDCKDVVFDPYSPSLVSIYNSYQGDGDKPEYAGPNAISAACGGKPTYLYFDVNKTAFAEAISC